MLGNAAIFSYASLSKFVKQLQKSGTILNVPVVCSSYTQQSQLKNTDHENNNYLHQRRDSFTGIHIQYNRSFFYIFYSSFWLKKFRIKVFGNLVLLTVRIKRRQS